MASDLIGGPLCGTRVRFTSPELRIYLTGERGKLVAIYDREADDYLYRETLLPAEVPKPKLVAAFNAEPVRTGQPPEEPQTKLKQWRFWCPVEPVGE